MWHRPGHDSLSALDLSNAEKARQFSALARTATDHDGQPPFGDQSLVELRSGERVGLTVEVNGDIVGAAVHTLTGDTREAELVVQPSARHRGIGTLLLRELIEVGGGEVAIWAHGDHPDARSLAASHGLSPERELLQLRARISADSPSELVSGTTPGVRIDRFRPGIDDADWLALNALAFAAHPEQGRLDQSDLDARVAEPWFDADDFLIARNLLGAMVGFCWLKVDRSSSAGEFYAVGVAPVAQGTGLGRALVTGGLARLTRRGIRTALLYVEADNRAAVTLYRSVGFSDHSVDILYRLRRN